MDRAFSVTKIVLSNLPLLYSFRRCPYAIRARLALKVSNIQVELREVVLSAKPQQMLDISAKGTVPVLQLKDGSVIEESRDIMLWALNQNDPQGWLQHNHPDEVTSLIDFNDNEFKQHLDHYKYADRFPEMPMTTYRKQGEDFLIRLEQKLSTQPYLMGERITIADMAIFPFVRQFAYVDKAWFDASEYKNLQHWLQGLLDHDLFSQVMHKFPQWQADNEITLF